MMETNMLIQNKTITLAVDGGNCIIRPDSRRTIAILNDSSGTVTFIFNGSLSSIGDELVIIAKSESALEFLFLPENGVIFTSCRQIDEETFNPESPWVGHFFFDGEKFLDTYENC